jgi:hypothetical protein
LWICKAVKGEFGAAWQVGRASASRAGRVQGGHGCAKILLSIRHMLTLLQTAGYTLRFV